MRGTLKFLFCACIVVGMIGCSGSKSTTGGGGNNVTVSVVGSSSSVMTFGKVTFTATVTGTSNTAVTWQVNGVNGGSATTGAISATGVYTAPNFISGALIPANSNATVTITAVSQASATSTGSAMLTLLAQGQAAQNGAIELGTSGSNINASSGNTCCGGTLGSLVVRNGTNFILSNNHVMANSDSASLGAAIVQPGLIDNPAIQTTCQSAGTTTVANLSQFFKLEGNPPNPVDAAIAQIVAGDVDTSGNILLLGATTDANGVPVPGAPHAGSGVAASVGMAVAKSGRSSGLTCSTIETNPGTFSVAYEKVCGGGTSFTVMYSNQVGVTGGSFSSGGDSGSLIVTQSSADAVALLFAGSDTDAVGNPIGAVLSAMADASNHVPTIVGGAAHQVIGCTLPPAGAIRQAQQAAIIPAAQMQSAAAARDTNASQLLAISGVRSVSVGQSLDYPGQPAIILLVAPGTPHNTLPVEVDGVRTRIIETADERATGVLSADEAQQFAPQADVTTISSLSAAEVARGKAAHAAHVDEWMKQPGVQGFGVSSSADSAGEAALIIYLIRGAAHNLIPATIDGLRTRVRESGRFRAGRDGSLPQRGCAVDPAKTAAISQTLSLAPKLTK